MTITLPAELTEPLSWIGMEWPQADEDLLLASGRAWIAHATRLRAHAAEADAVARRVWLENEGATAEAFERWWQAQDGPGRHLEDGARAAELIGAGLVAMAGVTVALKTAYIVQLTLLALQVAQAVATAFATAGATLAEIPAWVALSRAACRELLHQAVQVVEQQVAQLFKQAADLLRSAGNEAAASSVQSLATRLSKGSEFHRLMREVERADVRPPVDGAHFYSGKAEDGTRMRVFAEKHTDGVTAVTLEQTPGGQRFDELKLFAADSPVGKEHALRIWGRLSERYAQSAEGEATAWVHDPLAHGIWLRKELPALTGNPNVTSINVVDPA